MFPNPFNNKHHHNRGSYGNLDNVPIASSAFGCHRESALPSSRLFGMSSNPCVTCVSSVPPAQVRFPAQAACTSAAVPPAPSAAPASFPPRGTDRRRARVSDAFPKAPLQLSRSDVRACFPPGRRPSHLTPSQMASPARFQAPSHLCDVADAVSFVWVLPRWLGPDSNPSPCTEPSPPAQEQAASSPTPPSSSRAL